MADLTAMGAPKESHTWLRVVRPAQGNPWDKRPGRNAISRIEVVTDGEIVATLSAIRDLSFEFPLDGVMCLMIRTLHFEEVWEESPEEQADAPEEPHGRTPLSEIGDPEWPKHLGKGPS